jgi:hypothetical protein
MRRNRIQAELAESYGVSQPAISRSVTGVTPLLGRVLEKYVPTADELDGRTQAMQQIGESVGWPYWSASRPATAAD